MPTILGARLVGNPYSVRIMRMAAINLYGNGDYITVNKKYIRFKPADEAQLRQLIDLDLELFDYPLDYDVLQEGDYYDQGLPADEIPWYYTVVDSWFIPPSGIQYQQLASLYVPDDDLNLENEAFAITGNPVESLEDCTSSSGFSSTTSATSTKKKKAITTNELHPDCGLGYHWDATQQLCVANTCPENYHWDAAREQCVYDGSTPTPPVPPPASRAPGGQLLVFDNALQGGVGQNVPVRQTRVVIKRYFKIDRTYTDDQGEFNSAKHFHNKMHIIVKFKNNSITTRGLKGARFYQMHFPIKQNIGKFKGSLNNITYVFTESTDYKSRTYRNWWAAHLMNAHREYNGHATALGVGVLPANLVVLLTSWEMARGGGTTVMNKQRNNNGTVPQEWIRFFLFDPYGTVRTDYFNRMVNSDILNNIDMSLGYNVIQRWRSDKVKALMYHELSHAAHYNKVGQQWWNSLVYSELSTIVRWFKTNFEPYGDGSDGVASEYASVAESWAEHVARLMCDRQYGQNSTTVGGSSRNYTNDSPVPGLTSHLNYLEDYNPNDLNNSFRWIPEGIYYDLTDVRNEFQSPVTDGVSNFTNAQMFNALDADVTSMPQYRVRLLQENGNNQATQVTELFNQYHY
jgi:hypothetical protein